VINLQKDSLRNFFEVYLFQDVMNETRVYSSQRISINFCESFHEKTASNGSIGTELFTKQVRNCHFFLNFSLNNSPNLLPKKEIFGSDESSSFEGVKTFKGVPSRGVALCLLL